MKLWSMLMYLLDCQHGRYRYTPDMIISMAKDPIVFAMANPDPEIAYQLAVDTRDDIIMATGRSDHPNQVIMFWDFRLFLEEPWMCEPPK